MAYISIDQAIGPLVAALDVGTSSVRVTLFDARGRAVQPVEARVRYKMKVEAGAVEIDADRLLRIICRSFDLAESQIDGLSRDGRRVEIEAVAISTFWHGLVGVNGAGQAVTPLYSWNDTRAAAEADQLRDQIDEDELHRRTGCRLHPSYWPAKLAWLRARASVAFHQSKRWMSIGEYLYLKLFRRPVVSVSMASATGLFNQNRCFWDTEIISHLGIDSDQLSPLAEPGEAVNGLQSAYARRWPAMAGARWFAALGDGASDNIGAGAITRDRAALMIGTSGALRSMWKAESVRVPQGLWCYRADRERFLMGGALSNGGDLYEWMMKRLRLPTAEKTEAALRAMEPDAHGLTILPFFSGERSTNWRADARAAIAGMGLDTTGLEILRAAMEAVAFRFAAIYDLLVEELSEPQEIIGSGRAMLRSPAWAQIITDVIGKPILVSSEAESASRGAALASLEQLGALLVLEDAEMSTGPVYLPDARRHARYRGARERHNLLYEKLIGRRIYEH
ncbi:MAG TPA: gluconokinase [Blastocatellia bacterium]|nr:gluconokinase [Blastocatellia bacterium]